MVWPRRRFKTEPNVRTFEPVWVSSVEHLSQFADIASRWPRLKRWLGIFSVPMPNDYPQLRRLWLRAPIIFFANGKLLIDDHRLHFEPTDPPTRFRTWKWFNLRSDLTFEIEAREIKSVERYTQPWAARKYYIFDWVRLLVTDSSLIGGDLLLAVGTFGSSMRKVHRRTAELYEAIRSITSSARLPGAA